MKYMSLHEPNKIPDIGNIPDADCIDDRGTENISKADIPNISSAVGAMDTGNPSTFKSKNTVTAHFDQLIEEAKALDPKLDDVKSEDMQRFIVLICNVALAGLIDGINCTVSYIRVGDDKHSPFYLEEKNDLIPGKHYLNDIFKVWAEKLDDDLYGTAEAGVNPPRMLCVLMLNNIKVAYYSSKTKGIKFYPFKTVEVAHGLDTNGLIGMSVDANGLLTYNINTLIDNLNPHGGVAGLDIRITDQVRKDLRNVLQNWSNSISPTLNNPFLWVINHIAVDPAVPESVLFEEDDVVVDETLVETADPFKNPGTGYKTKSLKLYKSLGAKFKAIYFENSNILFAATKPDGTDVTYGGKVIPATGLHLVNPITDDPNPFILGLQDNKNPGVAKKVYAKFIRVTDDYYCEPSENLFYYINEDNDVVRIRVMLENACFSANGVNDLLPVTKEFSQVASKKNYTITQSITWNNDNDNANVDLNLIIGGAVQTYTKVYTPDHIYGCKGNRKATNQDYEFIPQISIYPYIKVNNPVGDPVINRYFWTAYYDTTYNDAVTQDKYAFFRSCTLTDENNNVIDFSMGGRACADSYIKDWKNANIKAQTASLPDSIYFEYGGIELGRLNMPTATHITVNPKKHATVAVDMGSRNSILSMKVDGENPGYMFDTSLMRVVIFDGTFSNTIDDQRLELLGLNNIKTVDEHGDEIGANPIEDSFVSYLMMAGDINYKYDHKAMETKAMPSDKTFDGNICPFVAGRICGNISESLYHSIMLSAVEEAKKIAKKGGAAGGVVDSAFGAIDMFGNFKKELLKCGNGDIRSEVLLFVRECLTRMILNAVYLGCGEVEIRFSAPDIQSGEYMKEEVWKPSLVFLMGSIFNPNGITVNIANPVTEAEALFTDVKSNVPVTQEYTFIVDGGDSTFDASLMVLDLNTNQKSCEKTASIAYGGYSIIIKSISSICNIPEIREKINANPKLFAEMWGGNTARGENPDDVAFKNKIISTVFPQIDPNNKDKGKGTVDNWTLDANEQLIYKLVEKMPLWRAKNDISNYIGDLIELKYIFTLYLSVFECLRDKDFVSDGAPSQADIFLYGGTNNVGGNILWNPADADKYVSAVVRLMQRNEKANIRILETSTHIMTVDTTKKRELVTGIVNYVFPVAAAADGGIRDFFDDDDGAIVTPDPAPKAEDLHALDDGVVVTPAPAPKEDLHALMEKLDVKMYNEFVRNLFTKKLFSRFWKDEKCILEYDETTFNTVISGICGANNPKLQRIQVPQYLTSEFFSNVNDISDKGLVYMLIFKLAVDRYMKYVEKSVGPAPAAAPKGN